MPGEVTPVADPVVRPVTEELVTDSGHTVVGYPPSTVEISTGTVSADRKRGPVAPELPTDEPQ